MIALTLTPTLTPTRTRTLALALAPPPPQYVALRWASGLTPLDFHTSAGIVDALFQLSLCGSAVGIWIDTSRLSAVGGYRGCAVSALPMWLCGGHLD